ncbi:MAG: methyl-accepting chemotaxis protein [Pseudomonadales bacterium]
MKQLNSSASISRRSIVLLVVALVLGLTAFMVWLASSSGDDSSKREYISRVDELQAISQQLARFSQAASESDETAFEKLLVGADDFSRILDTLVLSSESGKLPVKVQRLQKEIDQVQNTWGHMELDVRTIAASKPHVLDLTSRADVTRLALFSLQEKYDEATSYLVRNRADVNSVALVQRQSLLVEKALRNLSGIMSGVDEPLIAKAFQLNIDELVRIHQRLVSRGVAGSRVASILGKGKAQLQVLQENGDNIFYASPTLRRINRYSDSISTVSSQLLVESSKLNDGVDLLFTEQRYARIAIVVIIALVVLFIIYRRNEKRLGAQKEANQKNQDAILRLLDELADLADGDLTVSATVTEDFTGAIADSINYSIDQLRSLVVSINQTSVKVSQEANDTRSTATYLSEASVSQAAAITNATDSIKEIVSSMDEVAGDADKSSKVAINSVDIANKGAGAVQNTINGMDKIREQIQKTSKQIKRLGESSQEIGDIISLINDIADQTNILSLNAAIQASMAGDAGRGFAVVADEVQRLAERSGAATKQIEVLVKAIQADTNEAVISMEQTTAEVVQGARLAQDAGVALEEIEDVSNNLAQLIQGISEAAGKQSLAAVDVASTMGEIQEITTQTSSGTEETARSIGSLAELAKDMRSSVSGFTLPADETISTDLPELSDVANVGQASVSVGQMENKEGVDPAASAA